MSAEMVSVNQQCMSFIGEQSLVVDPQGQGMGLQGFDFMDGYANKFFILSGSEGAFVSPRPIPAELRSYYDQLGIDIASADNTVVVPPVEDGRTVIERLQDTPAAAAAIARAKGEYVVPYMVTDEVAAMAADHKRATLASAATTDFLADKATFQAALAAASGAIKEDTGFDVAIPSSQFTAGDRAGGKAAYIELSQGGKKSVVLVRPKSASALGIFVLHADKGLAGFHEVLDANFGEDDSVLLEAFIAHNHSPSMQGARIPGEPYQHLYFGRQIISMQDGHVTYDASQIPFGPPHAPIARRELDRMEAVHAALGEVFIENHDISGIVGFDTVVNIDNEGLLTDLKITETNLHLPGSSAIYGAMCKLYPDGFSGIAHNERVMLSEGHTTSDFFQQHAASLVRACGEYGVFPVDASYPDKVDAIFFARDTEHLAQLRGAVQ